MPACYAKYGTIPILHSIDSRARKFHESKFYLAILNCWHFEVVPMLVFTYRTKVTAQLKSLRLLLALIPVQCFQLREQMVV